MLEVNIEWISKEQFAVAFCSTRQSDISNARDRKCPISSYNFYMAVLAFLEKIA